MSSDAAEHSRVWCRGDLSPLRPRELAEPRSAPWRHQDWKHPEILAAACSTVPALWSLFNLGQIAVCAELVAQGHQAPGSGDPWPRVEREFAKMVWIAFTQGEPVRRPAWHAATVLAGALAALGRVELRVEVELQDADD